MNKQGGFSFIELLLYLGLTAIVLGLFGSILVTTLRIQNQQSANQQIITELNFVMNVIKTDVRDAQSLTVSSTSISLVNTSSSTILIEEASGTITRKVGSGSAEPITTDRINVDNATFSKKTGSSGIEAVVASLTFSYNSENPQQQATQTLNSTIVPLNQ
ncbi:MAG: prepilin-type N-terminal cleavage/methylation domain-containing protein [Candidatus Harrisonbacteria bacterium]|nr:prepilin-type N-terminal cleavage/methylation domain-containing protein [Candidatus Harrisonbacteria bacterium]